MRVNVAHILSMVAFSLCGVWVVVRSMPDRFSFRTLPIATGRVVAVAPLGKDFESRDESNELEALINGDFSTVAQVHPRLSFQAIGSCPVPLRASVMRVCKSHSNPR